MWPESRWAFVSVFLKQSGLFLFACLLPSLHRGDKIIQAFWHAELLPCAFSKPGFFSPYSVQLLGVYSNLWSFVICANELVETSCQVLLVCLYLSPVLFLKSSATGEKIEAWPFSSGCLQPLYDCFKFLSGLLMTYSLLAHILSPLFFGLIGSKNCEFMPKGLQSLASC